MRSLSLLWAAAILLPLVGRGCLCIPAAAQQQAPPTLDQALSEALAKSAELASLQQQVTAAENMIAPAGALPDPMLSAGLSNLVVGQGLRLDQDSMSGLEFMLSQEVPRSVKRRLRRDVQSGELAMLQARLQDKRLDVIRQVKKSYLDLQYYDQALVVAEQNRDLAQDMLATAEARYATGKVMQQDVFQAQVRLSRMVDMLISMRRMRAAAEARLNRLLYRPPSQPIPSLPAITQTAVDLNAAGLAARADQDSPRLAEMRARLGQTDKSQQLAAQEIKPDYTFSLSYMMRQPIAMDPMSGSDMWSASIGINLPWFYRRQKVDQEVKAAQATRLSAEQDLAAMRNELAAMVEEMVIETQRAADQLSLVETGLLPQAEGAVAASRASYATGQGEILDLLDNQMNLYNLQLEQASLLADHERSLAELEYLAGGPLEAMANAK
jgi:outer membrane protein TolC